MYVPVMKNRTVEVSVLRQLSMMGVFDNTVIPMIELVQERTRSNMKNSFLQNWPIYLKMRLTCLS